MGILHEKTNTNAMRPVSRIRSQTKILILETQVFKVRRTTVQRRLAQNTTYKNLNQHAATVETARDELFAMFSIMNIHHRTKSSQYSKNGLSKASQEGI